MIAILVVAVVVAILLETDAPAAVILGNAVGTCQASAGNMSQSRNAQGGGYLPLDTGVLD